MNQVLNIVIVGTGRLSTKRIYPYFRPAGMKFLAVCSRHRENAVLKCALTGGMPIPIGKR
ncbi:hypothetical protein [Oceanispirochaeta sp.]|jgi:predicted dehydrogenase|uniref:hypothetical protein n=1 Tax=Oceanispirochaeta sp. TaxID=2035350 RepID=UPI0026229870|nr:hypothetical protein [Oceanispirochaeta sp.]MDA3958295.1 hypothetical protein [Oceanispirochaeta sp.]